MWKTLKAGIKGYYVFWKKVCDLVINESDLTNRIKFILILCLIGSVIWFPIACIGTMVCSMDVDGYEWVKRYWKDRYDAIS